MIKKPQALVLCGGKGERLRPITEEVPKPIVKIKDKSILGYIIDHLHNYGVLDILIATGYRSNKIEEYLLQDYSNYDFNFVNSGDVDIIYRIKDAAKYVAGDLMVLYGDTVSDVNIHNLINYHNNHQGKVTVTVWPLRSQFGILEFANNGMIGSYKEKPVLDKWINIGYMYIENSALQWISNFNNFEDYLGYLVNKRELNGYRHDGHHITINTLKELLEAEQNIDIMFQDGE